MPDLLVLSYFETNGVHDLYTRARLGVKLIVIVKRALIRYLPLNCTIGNILAV